MGQMVFNQGLNTAMDRSMLIPGELQLATGAYYRPGDTLRVWKTLGRTSYGDAYAATAKGIGIGLMQYDGTDADRLVVLNGNGEYHSSLVSSTDSTSGTFSTLTTGFSTQSSVLAWAHFDNLWYFCNGLNPPLCMRADGTVRFMGMNDPLTQPTAEVALEGTYESRPTSLFGGGTTGFQDLANGIDDNDDTAAYSWLYWTDGPGAANTVTLDDIAADTAATDRFYILRWSLNGGWIQDTVNNFLETNAEFHCEVMIEFSLNNGGDWTVALQTEYRNAQAIQSYIIPIADGQEMADVLVRMTHTQKATYPSRPSQLQLHDAVVTNKGFQEVFTTAEGFYYGVSEYSELDNLESPLRGSNLVTLTDNNMVAVVLPASASNATASHYRLYRTHDGGKMPGDFRYLDMVPVGTTTYYDRFKKDKDDVFGDLPPFLKVQITDSMFRHYASNTAPEAFKAIVEYQNFLVALSEQEPRKMMYSLPGDPESWPLLYQIIDFPLKEHDTLQSLGVAGDLLIIGATDAIIVVNGLPELEAQSYANASMTVLRGASGCVGPRAMAEYSLAGEPRVMWVSNQGVFQTNGHIVQELSADLDWANTVSQGKLADSWMFWDKDDQIMSIGVDTDGDGVPDREYWFHLAEEHRKQNGRPKVTGPHYSSKSNQAGGFAADGAWRVYSLDNDTSGSVYHEKDGGTDAGNFFSTLSEVLFDIKGPRQYWQNLVEWAVDFPTVRHTSWNNTAVSIQWTVGRDEIGESDTATTTMTISTQGQTKFMVGRSGEWHEVRVVHTADASTGAALLWFEQPAIPMNITGDTQDS